MAEMGDGLERFFRFGEGRRMKRMQEQASYIATLEPEFQALSDAAARRRRPPSSASGSTTARS